MVVSLFSLWEHTGSNRGPSACKADALNQLSYAPFLFWDGKDKGKMFSAKFFTSFRSFNAIFFNIFSLFLLYKYVNLRKYQIPGRHRYLHGN